MLDKQRTILTSAYNVFCRYGVKRATMNDIATEAGVARQTLYNTFNNKETIIQAIMLHYTEATLAEIEAFQTSEVPFEDVLEHIFDEVSRNPYELINNTPHGQEILEGINQSSKEILADGNMKFAEALSKVISERNYTSVIKSPAEIADFVIFTAMGHKHKATSREHLESLLATLKTSTLLMLGLDPGSAGNGKS